MRNKLRRISVLCMALSVVLAMQVFVILHWWPIGYVPMIPRCQTPFTDLRWPYLCGFSPNDKTLYTFFMDRNNYDHFNFVAFLRNCGITAWDTSSGEARFTLQGAHGCLALSPDSSLMAAASINEQGQRVGKIWDAVTGEDRLELGPLDSFCSGKFTQDGKSFVQVESIGLRIAPNSEIDDLLCACVARVYIVEKTLPPFQAEIRLWDLATGRLVAVHRVPWPIKRAELSGNAESLVVVDKDRAVTIFGTRDGVRIGGLSRPLTSDELHLLRPSPDGKLLVTGSTLWDLQSGLELKQLSIERYIEDVGFSSDCMTMFVVTEDKIAVYETTTWTEVCSIPHQHRSNRAGAWSSIDMLSPQDFRTTGRPFEWYSDRNKLLLTDNNSFQVINGRKDLESGGENYVEIWDLRKKQKIARLSQCIDPCVSSSGKLVATSASLQTFHGIILWDLPPRTNAKKCAWIYR